jgi:hypothetical protein
MGTENSRVEVPGLPDALERFSWRGGPATVGESALRHGNAENS